uniref:pentatricopeptide repeat-containing protein At3g53700, chloroplastic-like n=1 Tax=Fragaria vesca subsp. vesca TaxID=101020 RepID=UPI0005C85CB3|nr:PREDICTED: pentatricopeptide repeat-containing protein At3g53700, chloroplastic-like [Fragaria vesca subsp. vesca]
MDSNYTAKLVYSGERAAVSFDHNVSYFDFANFVRDRFSILGRSIMKLSASGSKRVLSNNVTEQSSISFDENDYLGCYKPEEAKRYCSKGWENYIKSKDQKFQGGVEEFRLKLRMYAIKMEFEYRFPGVVCLQTNKMMGSKIIKSIMLDKVRENPNKKASAIDIYHEIKSDYGMEVSYRTAWYGKEHARESAFDGDADFYAQLVWFGQKAVESNSGSTIKIEYEPETHKFQRMIDEAKELFVEVKGRGILPDVIVYSALIHGLYYNKQWEAGKALLHEMVHCGIKPNLVTFNVLTAALCRRGNVNDSRDLLKLMIQRGVSPDLFTYNTLIDDFCLAGCLNDARELFHSISSRGCQPDAISYNVLISG